MYIYWMEQYCIITLWWYKDTHIDSLYDTRSSRHQNVYKHHLTYHSVAEYLIKSNILKIFRAVHHLHALLSVLMLVEAKPPTHVCYFVTYNSSRK